LPLGIGGTLLGKPIMNFIYGAKYLNGVIGFQILIWACVLSFITSIYGFGLIGCDRERRYALGVMVGTICNLCLNFILIPQFSLTGAAIATVAAEGVMFAIMYFEFRKVINVPFLPYIPKSLLSSILMGCVIYNLKNINVIIVILIGAAVYTLSLYLLRGITEEDISFIKKLIWKK
jgi:O-antigen/teichoic acid export membrane protein